MNYFDKISMTQRSNREVANTADLDSKTLSDKLIKAFREKVNTNQQMTESMDPFIGESPKSP